MDTSQCQHGKASSYSSEYNYGQKLAQQAQILSCCSETFKTHNMELIDCCQVYDTIKTMYKKIRKTADIFVLVFL